MINPARLKKARRDAKISQTELSEKLDITLRAYRSYENGERDVSTALLLKICKTLKVSADWLLEEEESFEIIENTPKILKSKDYDVEEYFKSKEKAPTDEDDRGKKINKLMRDIASLDDAGLDAVLAIISIFVVFLKSKSNAKE